MWCQQNDRETLKPAPARAYELPSYCSAESAGIVRLLMELPAPDARVKRAVHGAMKWFDRYKLTGLKCERIVLANGERDTRLVEDPQAKPIWARYYDLKYCEPYVCDRDGLPRRHLEEIGTERRWTALAFSHDKVRRTLDGEGTYDRVVSSCKAAMRNGIDVTVRLNVSQDNIDMLRHSNWRHSDFKYEIHRVEYPLYEKAVSFWQLLELCLNGYISLTELAVNQVGYFYQIFEEDQAHYPLFGDCLSGSVLLFSPEGAVYDCNEAGTNSVPLGMAEDDSCSYFESVERYLSGRAFQMEIPCSECPASPVCGGACRVRRGDSSSYKKCPYYSDISDMLKRYISWKTGLQGV